MGNFIINRVERLPKEFNYPNGKPMFAVVRIELNKNLKLEKLVILKADFSSFRKAERYLRENYNKLS